MPSDEKNLKSALEQPRVVRQKIQAEIEKGRVAGPFINRCIKTLRVSPIGLVPQKRTKLIPSYTPLILYTWKFIKRFY